MMTPRSPGLLNLSFASARDNNISINPTTNRNTSSASPTLSVTSTSTGIVGANQQQQQIPTSATTPTTRGGLLSAGSEYGNNNNTSGSHQQHYSSFSRKWLEFLAVALIPVKPRQVFENEADYKETISGHPYRYDPSMINPSREVIPTLSGDFVRSQEEVAIANLLWLI